MTRARSDQAGGVKRRGAARDDLGLIETRRRAYPTHSCGGPDGPSTALEQAGDPARRVAQNQSQHDVPPQPLDVCFPRPRSGRPSGSGRGGCRPSAASPSPAACGRSRSERERLGRHPWARRDFRAFCQGDSWYSCLINCYLSEVARGTAGSRLGINAGG